MDQKTMVKVLNRDNGAVVYSIPEMNGLRRVFQAGETKEISFQELQKLSYKPGGRALLADSLVIMNSPEAIQELVGAVQPEYNYTKDDVIRLMKEGSLDEFLDCLDFAPQGVKDLIKTLAVQLPLNDVAKREAIYNKMGYNVDNAIRIYHESNADAVQEQPVVQRRVKKDQSKEASQGRRITKVITK